MTVLVRWGEVVEKDRVADDDAVDVDVVVNEDCRSEEVVAVVEERREARAMRGRAGDEGNNVGGMMLVVCRSLHAISTDF